MRFILESIHRVVDRFTNHLTKPTVPINIPFAGVVKVPVIAKYVAIDPNGDVYWYRYKPTYNQTAGEWESTENYCELPLCGYVTTVSLAVADVYKFPINVSEVRVKDV